MKTEMKNAGIVSVKLALPAGCHRWKDANCRWVRLNARAIAINEIPSQEPGGREQSQSDHCDD